MKKIGVLSVIVLVFLVSMFWSSFVYAIVIYNTTGTYLAVDSISINNSNPHVGEAVEVVAQWNATVNNSVLAYNTTTYNLENTTAGNLTFNSSLTNYTFTPNTTWTLGEHVAKIYVIDAFNETRADFASNETSNVTFTLWGWSNTTVTLLNSTITKGQSTIINCTAADANSSSTLAEYYVEIFDGTTNLSAGTTNSNGNLTYSYTPTTTGTHTITCNLYDNSTQYYNSSSNATAATLTVNAVPSEEEEITTDGVTTPIVTITENKTTLTFTAVSAGGTAEIEITDDFSITKLAVTVNTGLNNFVVIIKEIIKPTGIPKPEGEIFRYLTFTKSLIADTDIDNIKIQFKVPIDWLDANDIGLNGVVMKKYITEWNNLTTTRVDSDSDFIYYEAETSGFSTFAIAGIEGPPAEVEEDVEVVTPLITSLLWIIVLVIVIIAVYLFFKPKKKK